MTRNPADDDEPRVCSDCDEDGEPCRNCDDRDFEPPDRDDSRDDQGEVEWESPE